MDVHPPHQPIHTWRDFFIHLATITIGLLIALALEAAAESLHHSHLVHVARTSIRLEMQQNLKFVAEDLTSVRGDQTRIEGDIKQLVALRGGAKLEHASLQYHLEFSSFSDAAWRTSQSSGALNFMDYQTAESLTDVYVQQQTVSDFGLRLFNDQTRAVAPIFITGDANLMSKDEIQIVLLRSADILLGLKGLEQLLTGLDEQLSAALHSAMVDH